MAESLLATNRANRGVVVKRSFFIFLPIFIFLLSVAIALYQIETKAERKIFEEKENHAVNIGNNFITGDMEHIIGDLKVLTGFVESENFFNDSNRQKQDILDHLSNIFLRFSAKYKHFDQIRLLDDTGMELIRINFDGEKASIVPKSELQNKAHRYYFKDTITLDYDEIYISPFDLNIEHGIIEEPFKPMIRFGMVVFDKRGRKRGAVVLNYLGVQLINRLEKTSLDERSRTLMINSDGYWLKGPSHEKEWGFMFDNRHDETFSKDFPKAWQIIKQSDRGQFQTSEGLFTFIKIYPLYSNIRSSTGSGQADGSSRRALKPMEYYWTVISLTPPKFLYEKRNNLLSWGAGLFTLLAVLLFIGSMKVASAAAIREQAEKALRDSKSKLEVMVERRTAELKESEEKYRSIMESMEDAVYICSSDFRIEYMNPSMVEKIGENSLGKICHVALYDLDDSCTWCVQEKIQGGDFYSYEFTSPKDGRTYLISNSPIYHEDGTISKLTIFRDISKLKLAEIDLKNYARERDKRLKELNCLYSVSRLFSDTGLNESDLLEKTVNLLPPACQYPEICCARITFNKEEYKSENFAISDWILEKEVPVNDKSTLKVEVYYSEKKPTMDEGPFLKEERGLINIITERLGAVIEYRRSEAEKKRSEERFHTLVETMNEGLAMGDANGLFTYVNRRFCEMIQRSPGELVGTNPIEFLEPSSRDVWKSQFELRKTGVQKPYEITWATKNDNTVITTVSPAVIKDLSGKFSGSFAVFSDVTEQRKNENEREKLRAQLQQSQKMEALGTLAGGIAHDFNNILSAIIGYGQLAEYELPKDHPVMKNLSKMLKASHRAAELVRQILSFSRQTKGDAQPIEIIPIIKEALKLLRASTPATIDIQWNITTESGVVVADPTQIHQIMMNLCTNACHAMRDNGGVLLVTLEQVDISKEDASVHLDLLEGPQLRLSVSDTGHGMEQDKLDLIFDPFYTTKDVGEGTGLGLSVVHGILQNLKGAIKVYSEPGKGTTFQLYLPRLKEGARVLSEKDDGIIPKGTESVLLVDDEAPLVEIGIQFLKALGYQITGLTSSVEALRIFTSQPDQYDLVITDQTMPKMTGIEMSREMLKVRNDIPIIICSGFSDQLLANDPEKAGVKDFLMKPLVISQLARSIRSVLDA